MSIYTLIDGTSLPLGTPSVTLPVPPSLSMVYSRPVIFLLPPPEAVAIWVKTPLRDPPFVPWIYHS